MGLAPSTLRALIADGARAGIAPPFIGAERARPHRRTLSRIWGEDEPRQPLHGIRHTFASTLAGAGVPELIIGALVGHAGSTTRDTYIDPASLWSAMVDAVAKIPPVGQCVNLDERRRAAGSGDGR